MLSVRGYKSPCLCFHRLPLLLLPRQDITILASSIAGTRIQTHTHGLGSSTNRAKKHDDGNGWMESEEKRGDRLESISEILKSVDVLPHTITQLSMQSRENVD